MIKYRSMKKMDLIRATRIQRFKLYVSTIPTKALCENAKTFLKNYFLSVSSSGSMFVGIPGTPFDTMIF